MTSYGLDDRDEVNELEFLGLLAFLAREAMCLRGVTSTKAGKKFSPNDLEMAYAFRNQYGRGGHRLHPSPMKPVNVSFPYPSEVGSRHVSPGHDRHPPNVPHYHLDVSPKHHSVMTGQGGQMGGNIIGWEAIPVGHGGSEQWMSERRQDERFPSQSPPRRGLEMGQAMMSNGGKHPDFARHSTQLGGSMSPGTSHMTQQMSRDGRPITMLASTDFPTRHPLSPLQLQSPHGGPGVMANDRDLMGAQEKEQRGLGMSMVTPHSGAHNYSFGGHGQLLHPLEGERGMMNESRSSGQFIVAFFQQLFLKCIIE